MFDHPHLALSLALAATVALSGCSDDGSTPPVDPPPDATVLHVSAKDGAAGNDGSAAHPFATIEACVTVAVAGQTCEVAEGVYGEMVKPLQDGITVAAVPGQSVTVTAADPVTGWTSSGNGVYAATHVQVATNVPMRNGHAQNFPGYQLFQDQSAIAQAQYPAPASDALHPHWATIAAATPETTTANGKTTVIPAVITDANAPSIRTPGAIIHLWSGSDPFEQYAGLVQAAPGGSVTYSDAGVFETNFAAPGGLYYLVGAPELLTANTWAYDAGQQVLYWQAPSGVDPNKVDVRFKQRYATLDLSGRSNVTVRGLRLVGAGVLMDAGSNGNVLDGITATFLSSTQTIHPNGPSDNGDYYSLGVILDGRKNTLKNSVIAYTALNGVTIHGSGNAVMNTLIHDVGTFGAGGGAVAVGDGAANVDGAVIANNTVYNTGRSAIAVNVNPEALTGTAATHVTGLDIAHNNLFNTMLLSADGGAIYGCCRDETTGSRIHDNWIHGETSPDAITFPASSTASHPYAGIYYDNGLGGVQIANNVVWASSPDIFIHGDLYGTQRMTSNVDILNNTIPDSNSRCNIRIAALALAGNVDVMNNRLLYAPSLQNQVGTTINASANSPADGGVLPIDSVGCAFNGCAVGNSPPPIPAGTGPAAAPASCD